MFNKKKQPPIKSLIANGTLIQGHVQFAEGLRIDGEVIGDIRASAQPSILVISETARVNGQRQRSCVCDHLAGAAAQSPH